MPNTKRSPKRRAARSRSGRGAGPQAAAKRPTSAKPPFTIPRGWTVGGGGKRLVRELKTKDFLEAVRLVNELASVAEALEHHPDLHIERWNHLRIETYSHDVGKLTDRDERLALRINDALARMGRGGGRGSGAMGGVGRGPGTVVADGATVAARPAHDA